MSGRPFPAGIAFPFALLIVVGLLSLGATTPLSAATLNVPSEFSTIQLAINAAQPGDLILVQPGMYPENIDLLGKAITLAGSGAELTTLDGSFLTRGPGEGSTILCESGEADTTVIQGFTIRGGTGRTIQVQNAQGGLLGNFKCGGGLLALGSSPSIQNCVFTANDAQFGSGVYYDGNNLLGTKASLNEVTFANNSGLQGSGAFLRLLGGISNIQDCIFSGNTGNTAGGGLMLENSGAVIARTTFQGNNALLGGGALLQDSGVVVSNSTFTQNDSTLLGGALLIFGADVTIEDSNLTENTAGNGAAIGCDFGTATIRQCLIADNVASTEGGAIATSNNPVDLMIQRCTIANNVAPTAGGIFVPITAMSTGQITESILWGNSGFQVLDGGQFSVEFSNVLGGYLGVGNIGVDPLFSDSAAGDYSLAVGSPSIDARNPPTPTSPADADGTPRDQGAIFFDQRPDLIASVDCVLTDPCIFAYTVSWPVNDAYDLIRVSLDGVEIGPLDGTQTSTTVLVGAEGIHEICLTPEFGTFVGGQTCCQTNTPPIPTPAPVSDLACEIDQATCMSTVTWTNSEPYSELTVSLDGVLFTSLPGNSTTVTVPVAVGSLTEITISGIAVCGGATVPPSSCSSGCNIDYEPFLRGDANGDSQLDISDALNVIFVVFGLGQPLGCQDAGDANDDGGIDISDGMYILGFVFEGSAPPPAPGVLTCGVDPTDNDPLNCSVFLGCTK